MKEYCRPILFPDVRTLAIQSSRVVHSPKRIQQRVKRDSRRVVSYFNCFCVPGPARTDVSISRAIDHASGVTNSRVGHAVDLTKGGLDSPKTSCCKRCDLHFCSSLTFSTAIVGQLIPS